MRTEQTKKKKRIYSPTKRKILLLLQAGFVLGLTHSPKNQRYLAGQFFKAWKDIDKEYLKRSIREFYTDRLIDWKENADGTATVVLTELGKKRVLEFNIDEIKIKHAIVWDKKWRVVFFDIPEKKRRARDALRSKLKELGFCELQKSIFVFPFECKDEIDFIVEFFEIRRYVRYAEMMNISNEAELKLHFNL